MQHVGSGLGKEAGYLAPGAGSVVARAASRRARRAAAGLHGWRCGTRGGRSRRAARERARGLERTGHPAGVQAGTPGIAVTGKREGVSKEP